MLTEDAISDGESNKPGIVPPAEIGAREIIDLDKWIVAVEKPNSENQTADGVDRQVEAKVAEQEAASKEEQPFTLMQDATVGWTHLTQRDQTQLAFSFS